MTDPHYTDFTPGQQLSSAFNIISNAKTELPKHLYDRLTIVQQELDAVIRTVQHDYPSINEPLPIPLPDYYRDHPRAD